MKQNILYVIISFSLCINALLAKHSSEEQANYVLTLEQAVEDALKHRPDLQALSYSIQALQSGAKSQLAGYYPLVTLNTSFTYAKSQPYPVNNTILDIKQLIYSFSGPQQQYQRAQKLTQQTEYEKDIQKNSIRLVTEVAFLQAWLQQETQKTIAYLEQSSAISLAKSSHEQKLKLLDMSVWLKANEEYGNNANRIEQYDYDVSTAFKRLELLMGQAQTLITHSNKRGDAQDTSQHKLTHLIWQPSQNIDLESLEHYYNLALHYRPELKQAAKKIEFEQCNIKIAQGLRLPSLSFEAQAGHTALAGESFGTSRNQRITSIALGATWTLFDGLINQYQEQQAYANKIKEMLSRDQIALNIKQEVQEKYHALLKAQSAIKSQKLTYLRMNNDFIRSEQEYKAGTISRVDFAQAKTTWENAQLDWLTRTIDAALAECNLAYACGYPPNIHTPQSTKEAQ